MSCTIVHIHACHHVYELVTVRIMQHISQTKRTSDDITQYSTNKHKQREITPLLCLKLWCVRDEHIVNTCTYLCIHVMEYIYIYTVHTWTFNWYFNLGYDILGLQVPEKVQTQKIHSAQDLNPCDPVKSDTFLCFACVCRYLRSNLHSKTPKTFEFLVFDCPACKCPWNARIWSFRSDLNLGCIKQAH